MPKGSANLHVRVMKPMMSQTQSTASLAVGPFADSAKASAFCDSIQARDRGLYCHYEGSAVGTQHAQLSHGEAYSNRRKAEARKHLQQNPQAAAPSKQYWVQVVSASNQMEALHQWEEMKANNSDLLNGMRSSVSPSATDHSVYVVRVGPVANNDDAIQFCTKLQARSIDCRVLLYSAGP